jgi:putative two-component system hydrogenase maturation factor HypX/HoxX
MRLLLLCHAFNSLTQRLWVELNADGHEVSVEFDVNDTVTGEAVAAWRPDAVVASYLRRRIPESVWRRHPCLVVHPGIVGDRGPSALDWALQEGVAEWGVTVLRANAEMDAGDVYATATFPLRAATKSSVYRNEVTEAAVAAVREALAKLAAGVPPTPPAAWPGSAPGRLRPLMTQDDRALDWARDDTATVLRHLRAADGFPGVRDELLGLPVLLFDAHADAAARGTPGEVIGRHDGAVLRATVDGAVWIGHLKRADDADAFKQPAARVLGARLDGVPEVTPVAVPGDAWPPIRWEERGDVGVLHFAFHNGAFDTAQCEALRLAFLAAAARPVRVLLLAGGPDFWSNGIHLNAIEAAAEPAHESWRNINAMNDLVHAIVTADRQLTVAALQGNGGAGGVFLALAADRVWARDGAVLNPHYKGMGNLYGSEYWTYLLPRRVTPAQAAAVTQARLPVGVTEAKAMGLIDDHFGRDPASFLASAIARAQALADDPGFDILLGERNARRAADEAAKPLAAYRAEELERMKLNFYGFDSSYHVARWHFVHKSPRSRTPLWLARHRARPAKPRGGV